MRILTLCFLAAPIFGRISEVYEIHDRIDHSLVKDVGFVVFYVKPDDASGDTCGDKTHTQDIYCVYCSTSVCPNQMLTNEVLSVHFDNKPPNCIQNFKIIIKSSERQRCNSMTSKLMIGQY